MLDTANVLDTDHSADRSAEFPARKFLRTNPRWPSETENITSNTNSKYVVTRKVSLFPFISGGVNAAFQLQATSKHAHGKVIIVVLDAADRSFLLRPLCGRLRRLLCVEGSADGSAAA